MPTIDRIGFGQVEPNHLSAQRTGQIYAQLPAKQDQQILENGQFVKYDYPNKQVNFTGDGEWMLVFNEIKLYDPREQGYKDYAMKKGDFTNGSFFDPTATNFGGEMVPRVFKTNVGDIFTTNTLEAANTSNTAKVTGTETIAVGNILSPNAQGYLSKTGDGTIEFQVAKITTMPDGQDAVKLMRIK